MRFELSPTRFCPLRQLSNARRCVATDARQPDLSLNYLGFDEFSAL
jgi:hypothetical protein